jgi:hypothetical protein
MIGAMARPLPIIPRGPRRRRVAPPTYLLACPRVSSDWELGALDALMKPKELTRGRIAHRPAHQPMPAEWRTIVEDSQAAVRDRLGFDPPLHVPPEGDYFFVLEFPKSECESAKALALLLSRHLPDVWLTLGRLFIRDGKFHRRERGWKLNLIPALDVHLTRAIRAAMRDLL